MKHSEKTIESIACLLNINDDQAEQLTNGLPLNEALDPVRVKAKFDTIKALQADAIRHLLTIKEH